MHTRANSLLVAILVVVLVLGGLYVFTAKKAVAPAESPIATVQYSCKGGKTMTAVYYKGTTIPGTPEKPPVPGGKVELTLSDGRSMTLPQTISADGSRYGNADESFVFWSKGEGALVLENNQEKSYIGCIAIAPEPEGQRLPQVYSNSQSGFSLRLPAGYTINESYEYQEFGPGKGVFGAKFTIPLSMATGTNLGSDTYLSVEEIPRIQNCTAALFLAHAATSTVQDAGITYSLATTTGAAAGNRYDEAVYAIPGTNPCIGVRYWIHYGVLENYPPGSIVPFNPDTVVSQFDAIRRTLRIVQ